MFLPQVSKSNRCDEESGSLFVPFMKAEKMVFRVLQVG
jgi:hypothetical protein